MVLIRDHFIHTSDHSTDGVSEDLNYRSGFVNRRRRIGMTNNHEYNKLMSQIKVVKDRVRGVVNGTYNGMYLYGRAGTSKTHTVCSTFDTVAVNYAYSNGHLSPIGLFDLISENRDRVIVLTFEEPSERINNWKERIGKSQAAFYRS